MKRKKLLTMAAAGMLAAAQMAMPVMAVDGGEVDVDVETKTAIIRVEVPTSMEIAVNQFEKGDDGSQIYSTPFGIVNKSEIPVKVSVTSTATLASTDTITLVSTKEAAEKSTAATGEAWLAVAAQTADGKYIEDGKTIKDLTEANKNVTTFVQGTDTAKTSAEASQVFYLASAATDSVTYKGFVPSADGVADISYAQFYKLEEVTLTSGTEQDSLDAAIEAGDVYEVASSVTDLDGAALTLTAKKGGSATVATTGKSYYKAAATPTAKADLKSAESYVYGENAEGGKAAFRYLGKLSESKETWTATDISNINIAYDIVGVTTTRYTEAEKDCVYGLYAAQSAPVVLDANGLITLLVDAADVKLLVVNDGEADYVMNSTRGTWEVWDEENALQKFQLGSEWTEYLKGKSAKAVLTLQDDTQIESTVVSFPE